VPGFLCSFHTTAEACVRTQENKLGVLLNQPVCRASKGACPRPVPAGEDRAPIIRDLAGYGPEGKLYPDLCRESTGQGEKEE